MDASFLSPSLWKKRIDLNLPVLLQRRPLGRLVAFLTEEAPAGVDFWNLQENAGFLLNRKD